ncbi:MAG: hypothetical protein MK110_17665 [Fuerstiella sp.]|nr:hypothetical protein [Fuerstiella sp.]
MNALTNPNAVGRGERVCGFAIGAFARRNSRTWQPIHIQIVEHEWSIAQQICLAFGGSGTGRKGSTAVTPQKKRLKPQRFKTLQKWRIGDLNP